MKKNVKILLAVSVLLALCTVCIGVPLLISVLGESGPPEHLSTPVGTSTTEPTITPWIMPTRTPAPTRAPSTATPTPECICSYNAYNCDDPLAVYCFGVCGSDIHDLDRDGDGLPCED
jgi:hypothetical protein